MLWHDASSPGLHNTSVAQRPFPGTLVSMCHRNSCDRNSCDSKGWEIQALSSSHCCPPAQIGRTLETKSCGCRNNLMGARTLEIRNKFRLQQASHLSFQILGVRKGALSSTPTSDPPLFYKTSGLLRSDPFRRYPELDCCGLRAPSSLNTNRSTKFIFEGELWILCEPFNHQCYGFICPHVLSASTADLEGETENCTLHPSELALPLTYEMETRSGKDQKSHVLKSKGDVDRKV